jgi:hypothetical protein
MQPSITFHRHTVCFHNTWAATFALEQQSLEYNGKNIIAVSETLKEHLIQELHLDSKHISTIPNGFDTQH